MSFGVRNVSAREYKIYPVSRTVHWKGFFARNRLYSKKRGRFLKQCKSTGYSSAKDMSITINSFLTNCALELFFFKRKKKINQFEFRSKNISEQKIKSVGCLGWKMVFGSVLGQAEKEGEVKKKKRKNKRRASARRTHPLERDEAFARDAKLDRTKIRSPSLAICSLHRGLSGAKLASKVSHGFFAGWDTNRTAWRRPPGRAGHWNADRRVLNTMTRWTNSSVESRDAPKHWALFLAIRRCVARFCAEKGCRLRAYTARALIWKRVLPPHRLSPEKQSLIYRFQVLEGGNFVYRLFRGVFWD